MRWATDRRRQARRVVALVLGASIALGGCSRSWDTTEIDNPTTTEAVRYERDVQGVVASITDILSEPGPDLSHWAPSRDEGACVADRLVRRFTAAGLLERGFDPNRPTIALDYSEEDRVAAINVLVGCVDFAQGVLSLITAYDKLPLAEATCFSSGVARLGIDRDFAGGIIDQAQPDPFANGFRFGRGLSELATECIGEESLITALNPPRLPVAPEGAPSPSSTTSTTIALDDADDDLLGIVPGGPLDPAAGSNDSTP